jgi:hypothetical protein
VATVTTPWTEVWPDDHVIGADSAVWTVTDRQVFGEHVKVTIIREGRQPISRTDPAGTVQVRRGAWGEQVAAAVDVFRGCGFTIQ